MCDAKDHEREEKRDCALEEQTKAFEVSLENYIEWNNRNCLRCKRSIALGGRGQGWRCATEREIHRKFWGNGKLNRDARASLDVNGDCKKRSRV